MHKDQPIEIALIKLAWVASHVVGCPKSTTIKGNTHHTNCTSCIIFYLRQAHGTYVGNIPGPTNKQQ